jgi:hypothetical protein
MWQHVISIEFEGITNGKCKKREAGAKLLLFPRLETFFSRILVLYFSSRYTHTLHAHTHHTLIFYFIFAPKKLFLF